VEILVSRFMLGLSPPLPYETAEEQALSTSGTQEVHAIEPISA
jgi:hypothetical protein